MVREVASKTSDEDENIGIEIVRRALEEPLRQIAQNAGSEGSIVVEKVRANNNPNFGFNAATEAYEDLVQAWYSFGSAIGCDEEYDSAYRKEP